PGSITFDPLIDKTLQGNARLASSIVWFDALVTNIDRTPRNTNLLVWHRRLWLIDHGASLYFHHNWDEGTLARAGTAFVPIREHVLLRWAAELREVDAELTPMITASMLDEIVAEVPESWLGDVPLFATIEEHRRAYRDWLLRRVAEPREWVEEAVRARTLLV